MAEAEFPPTTITQWQEREVQLDQNIRQSRTEEKVLAARGGENAAWGPLASNIQQWRRI